MTFFIKHQQNQLNYWKYPWARIVIILIVFVILIVIQYCNSTVIYVIEIDYNVNSVDKHKCKNMILANSLR